jgi:hypothetical protein
MWVLGRKERLPSSRQAAVADGGRGRKMAVEKQMVEVSVARAAKTMEIYTGREPVMLHVIERVKQQMINNLYHPFLCPFCLL